MEIPDTWAALLLGAVNDAMLFHDNLLQSETIKDKTDTEEHLMQLSILLEYMKDDYRQRLEPQGRLPLVRFLPSPPEVSNVVQQQAPNPSPPGNCYLFIPNPVPYATAEATLCAAVGLHFDSGDLVEVF